MMLVPLGAHAANPLDTWNLIQPNIPSGGIGNMAWGNGRWLAASGSGLLASTDGVDWRGVSLSRDFTIQAAAHVDGQWIGVGRNFVQAHCGGYEYWGGVFHSTDGLTWSGDLLREQGITFDRALVAVAHGGGRWIAVGGEYGRYVTSLDGLTWTPLVLGQFLSGDLSISSVGYGNGTWVAAGGELGTTAIFTSSNGLDWTRRSIGTGFIRRVVYADGQWVAAGGRNIWSSPDGIAWTPRYTAPGSDQFLNALAFGKGRWIVAGADAASSPAAGLLLTSTDATDWTPLRQDEFRAYTEVVFADNQWLVGGQVTTQVGSGRPSALLSSPDGLTWTDHTVINRTHYFNLSFADGRWVAVGEYIFPYPDRATITTSTDGLNWVTITPAVGGIRSRLSAVSYGDGQWLAVGSYDDAESNGKPITLTSPDGLAWTVVPGGPGTASSLAFGDGKWVCHRSSTVFTADRATRTWTARPSEGLGFGRAHYANGLWVGIGSISDGAGGRLPSIVTSPDAVTWTRRPVVSPRGRLVSVTWGHGQWLAVGEENVSITDCPGSIRQVALVMTSPDGVTWIQREAGMPRDTTNFSTSRLRDILWTGDEWMAVGVFDRRLDLRALILTSPDAIAWKIQPSITGETESGNWSAAFGNGRVVVTGDNILQVSDPILPRPPVLDVERVDNDVWLLLTGKSGRTYEIEESDRLESPSWTTIEIVTLGESFLRIPVPSTAADQRFWRARAR